MRSDAPPDACPFCDISQLPSIVRQDGDIIIAPNKYPIHKDSDPFVLIETADCDSDLSLYDRDRLLRVFRLAFDFWDEMAASGKYRSIMFLKNHGPLSGGSLRHPHSQIIGLYQVDCDAFFRIENYEGLTICSQPGVIVNISDYPKVGFVEFNILLTDEKAFPIFCEYIQKAVQYVMHGLFKGSFSSYNLFFHRYNNTRICKVLPRGIATPIYMGYSLPQTSDDLIDIADDFRNTHFT